MPKKWTEVVSSPEYQKLSPSQQEQARNEYFEYVVKPNVPAEDLTKAKSEFDDFSNPSFTTRVSNSIKSGLSSVANVASDVVDGAKDSLDPRTLSEQGLLKPVQADPNKASNEVEGVPYRADYVDRMKQQDRINPQSINKMQGTRLADAIIAQRGLTQSSNQEVNDTLNPEVQAPVDLGDAINEKRIVTQLAKAKAFEDAKANAQAYGNDDNALKQAVNAQPTDSDIAQVIQDREQQRKYGDIPLPSNTVDVVKNAAMRAVKQGSSMAQDIVGLGADAVGADEFALKMLKSAAQADEESAKYPAVIKDFTKIKSLSDVPTYILEGVIENAGMLAGSMGAGGIGLKFGEKTLSKAAAEKLTKDAVAQELARRGAIGAAAGASAASIGMESGSIYGDIYKDTGKQEPGIATIGGIAAGALDAIPATRALKTVLGKNIGQDIAQTIVHRYGVEALKQIGEEGATEFAQTWIEKASGSAASGKDVLTKDNLIESLDAMFKGGAAGGVTHVIAQGAHDLSNIPQNIDTHVKLLPDQNLNALRQESVQAAPQLVPTIDAEIARRDNLGTLSKAVEAGQRQIINESIPAHDLVEDHNVSEPAQAGLTDLANGASELQPNLTQGSVGDHADKRGSQVGVENITQAPQPSNGESIPGGAVFTNEQQPTALDMQAHAAATSPLNDTPEPTEAQKEAGNYKVGRINVGGLDISVENPDQSIRKGIDPDGKPWESTMNGHYGYVKGVEARAPDKEHIDVNVKPSTPENFDGDVFVINQNHPDTGKFDEPKVYIGYASKQEAEQAYRSNYADDWQGLGSIAQVPMTKFKSMLDDKKSFLKPVKELEGIQHELPFDVHNEISSNENYANNDIHNDINSLHGLSDDVTNQLLKEAGHDSTEQGNSGSTSTPENTQQEITSSNSDGSENKQAETPRAGLGEPSSVQPTPEQNSPNQDIGNQVERIVKRRAAANQLGKAKQFDKYLAHAKELLDGNPVNPSHFASASKLFKYDKVLSDAFHQLHELAKAPANKAKSNVTNIFDAFKQIIGDAKSTSELHAIARDIQNEQLLSDNKAQELDDLVMERLDSFDANEATAKEVEVNKSENVNDKPADNTSTQQTPESAMTSTNDELKDTTSKIDDFGEKIGGAKKDTYSAYKDKISNAEKEDVSAVPLSKSWPEPDYDELLSAGADPLDVAFIHAARDEVPTKPQKTYKLQQWVAQVDILRGLAFGISNGTISLDEAKKKLNEDARYSYKFRDISGRADLYALVGHSQSLKGVKIDVGSYSIYNGVSYSPAKTIWTVEKSTKATAFSNWPRDIVTADTREQLLKNFKEKFDSLTIQEPASREVSFDIYSKRGQNGFYVGKKVGRNYIDLEKFDSVKEARAYKSAHNAELVAKLEKLKEIPAVRRDTNNPRVGEDMREGKDVTPELFANSFGFRGVEFGNWVENKKRQQDLNDAFDALMDMAAILEIPPKAISLNGELGLAFGARGAGGIDPAAAHYEPDFIVINLTKKNGAGSLGHEWWHALDHYFSRLRSKGDGYMTEALDVRTSAAGEKAVRDTQVRAEMINAFGEVVKSIRATAIKARSSKLDGKRAKDYWTTGREMSARAYESYLISKLQDQNASNDYLANIVDDQTWKVAESLGWELDDSYPYPTAGEMPVIRAGFDHFFNTIQSKEDEEGNVALFSRSQDTKQKYDRRIDELFADGKPAYGKNSAIVLDRSDVLDMLGYGNKPVYLNESKVIDGKYNHGLTANDWKKIPEWLDNPAMVFDSDTVSGRLVVIAPDLINGAPVRMILEPDADFGGLQINLLVNAYDAQGKVPFKRWVDAGLLRYYNKAKSPAILARSGLQLPSLAQARGRGNKILRDSDLVKYRTDNESKFSRSIQQSGLPVDSVEKTVNQIKQGWKNAPDIVVVDDMTNPQIRKVVRDENERQLSQGAQGQPEAFFDNGKVYIVASEMQSKADIERVVFHETLGHYGLRGLYGAGLGKILDQIAMVRTSEMKAKAKSYGLKLDNPRDRRIAAEELLAVMAQKNPTLGFVKRAIAAIRTWLRSNVPYFRNTKISDDEIIKNYLLPARNFVKNGLKEDRNSSMLPAFQRVWHGSPHKFDKFSTNHIGSGEGAQAYGWGLYFAGKKDIAEHYRNGLSHTQIVRDFRKELPDDADFNDVMELVGTGHFTEYQDRVLKALNNDDWLGFDYPSQAISAAYKNLDNYDPSPELIKAINSSGQLYEVNIPEDDTMLLWDKPLSEQSDKVKAALGNIADLLNEERGTPTSKHPDLKYSGSGIYGFISKHFEKPEPKPSWESVNVDTGDRAWSGQKAASEYLHSIGINGIKYLDGTSRSNGDGSYNYVIFDDSNADIANTYFSRNNRKISSDSGDTLITAALEFLSRDPEFFQRPLTDVKDVYGIAKEIDSGFKVEKLGPSMTKEKKADRAWEVFVPGSSVRSGIIMTAGDKVWIDVSHLLAGKDRGSAIYDIAAAYAHNNGKVLVGDPLGLSRMAYYRRNENMLSSALKYGTTRHLEPHDAQVSPKDYYIGHEQSFGDSVRPLNWKTGDDVNNIKELVYNSYKAAIDNFPEIKDVIYNPTSEQFERVDGRPFTNKDFDDLVAHYYGSATSDGESRNANGTMPISGHRQARYSEATRGRGRTNPYRAGSATLKRAALFNTFLRSEGRAGGKRVLGELVNQLQRNGLSPSLKHVMYSRSNPLGLTRDNAFESAPDTRLTKAIRILQDKHIDLKQIQSQIKTNIGEIQDRFNTYLQEELYHGRAAKRTNDFLSKELNPLIKKMQTLDVSLPDFEEYLWMRHAPERNAKMAEINEGHPDGLAGVSTEDADHYLSSLDPSLKAKYQELSAMVDEIKDRTLDTLVAYGLESQATVDQWRKTYEHYVPLMREDMDLGQGNGTGQGFKVKGNSTRSATGSKRNVVDIIANIAQARERAIVRGEKNRVATALVGMAKTYPNDEFWKVDTPPTVKAVNKSTGLVESYTDPNYKTRDNVLVARIPDKLGEIKERSITFNTHDPKAMNVAKAMLNLDVDSMGTITASAAAVTRWIASVNTQYNPVFGLWNIWRDVQGSLINLGSTPLKGKEKEVLAYTGKAIAGIFKDLRENRAGKEHQSEISKLFEELQLEGGTTGYRDQFNKASDRTKAIEQAVDPSWWTKTTLGRTLTLNGFAAVPAQYAMDGKYGAKALFGLLSDYNETLENSVRLAVYKVALDNGISKQQAASLSKNISVNFNRKGAMGRELGAWYAFFNAAVQGTARIAETVLKDGKLTSYGKKVVYGGLLLGSAQALLLAAAGFNDDDPPDFIKDRNIIIPLGNGKYFSWALPLGYNAIPAIGRVATEALLNGGKDIGKYATHALSIIVDTFDPLGGANTFAQAVSPSAIDPMVSLLENKDWNGLPIYKEDFNSLDPTPGHSRAKDTASHLSIALSHAINTISGGDEDLLGKFSPTPDQIDYLIGQVTGGLGREISKTEQTATALFNGDDMPSYKIPIYGRLIGDTKENASQGNKYYSNITKLNGFERKIKAMESRDEDTDQYLKDNPQADLVTDGNIAEKKIKRLKKIKSRAVLDGAPKEEIKGINDEITQVMKELNDSMDTAKETVN